MTDFQLTRHAAERLRQRGRSEADVRAVLRFGTPTDPACVVLLDKDADREVARLKREIERLERLRGWKVIEADGRIVTTYKPRRMGQAPRPRRHKFRVSPLGA